MSMATSTSDYSDLKVIDQQLNSGINFLVDVRDFIKERADLEREYARRTEALAKKFENKADRTDAKRANFLSTFDETLKRPASFETASSSRKAWDGLLNQTLDVAKTHNALADGLSLTLFESVKDSSIGLEESRKKHSAFAARLIAEQGSLRAEREKAKSKYDEAADKVELSRSKYERAPDEKGKEKLKRLLHQDILDMNNCKNVYLLSLSVANQLKQKHFREDIPTHKSHLQALGERISQGLKDAWQELLKLQEESVEHAFQGMQEARALIENVDPSADSLLFLKQCDGIVEPEDAPFMPCGLWKDSSDMPRDDFSIIYLRNLVSKYSKRQEQAALSSSKLDIGIAGLYKLYQTYKNNPHQGDAHDVNEKILDMQREKMMLETLKRKYEIQVTQIIGTIGEATGETRAHSFKKSAFALPTPCDFCHQTIWGMTKAGLACRDCGFNAHVKCELKISPTCSTVKSLNRVKHKSSVSSLASARTSVSTASEASTITEYAACSPGSLATVLYDYKASMDEELSVSEGELVRVCQADDDGWTCVEKDGRQGLVPTSYIELSIGAMNEPIASEPDQGFAIYDYTAQRHDELTLKAGDLVTVMVKDDGSGWIEGSVNGVRGLVPASYIDAIRIE